MRPEPVTLSWPDGWPQGVDRDLLCACRDRAVALLGANTTPHGLRAASASPASRARNYTCVFARDAAICTFGLVATGRPELVEAARAGLRLLAERQAGNGQMPNFVDCESGEVDFWYTGCIDATLWWLLALRAFDRLTGARLGDELAATVDRALAWLGCQQHPGWRLLQQNEASDWADLMPRSGFVLYTNALWWWVAHSYGVPGAERTRATARRLFFPQADGPPLHRRLELMVEAPRRRLAGSPFFLSYLNLGAWGEEIDLFGNLLAVLTGVAEQAQSRRILAGIRRLGADRPYPLRVVGVPLQPDDPAWRSYLLRHDQNRPWQYHNGGIWPFVGGFWVLALQQAGFRNRARRALEQLARANRLGDWSFSEWLHGASGEPHGMPGQSWNAAMYLFALRCLSEPGLWAKVRE